MTRAADPAAAARGIASRAYRGVLLFLRQLLEDSAAARVVRFACRAGVEVEAASLGGNGDTESIAAKSISVAPSSATGAGPVLHASHVPWIWSTL